MKTKVLLLLIEVQIYLKAKMYTLQIYSCLYVFKFSQHLFIADIILSNSFLRVILNM